MFKIFFLVIMVARCMFDVRFVGDQPSVEMKEATLNAFSLVEQWLDLHHIIYVTINITDFGNSDVYATGIYTYHCEHPNNSFIIVPASLYTVLTNGLSCADTSTTSHITIKINNNEQLSPYYYGQKDVPRNHMDYITLLLHEIMHGLGFASQFLDEDGYYPLSPRVYLYDTFIFNIFGKPIDPPLGSYYPLPDVRVLKNETLRFTFGNDSFGIYSPKIFVSATTASHASTPNTLMYYRVPKGFAMRCLPFECVLFLSAMGYKIKKNVPSCEVSSAGILQWIGNFLLF